LNKHGAWTRCRQRAPYLSPCNPRNPRNPLTPAPARRPQGPVKKFMFRWGFARKLHFLREGFATRGASPFFDKLVFGKVLAARRRAD
jgi:hypothetical protein